MEQAQTVEKAVDILFHIHEQRSPVGVSAVARALEMPKSSTHRLCSTLARRGLLERDDHGRYSLGMALLTLAFGIQERDPLIEVAQPILRRFADSVGETFFLVGARNGSLYVLFKAEGGGVLPVSPRVGTILPTHATAVGKLYLAFAPEMIQPVAKKPQRFTSRTVVSQTILRTQVEKVRNQGYALSDGEWIDGLSVIAAPVRIRRRAVSDPTMLGAVAVALPSTRLDGTGKKDTVGQVVLSAEQISNGLKGKKYEGID